MRWSRIVVVALFCAVAAFEAYGFAEKLGYIRHPERERIEAIRRARDLDRRFVDALISGYQDTMEIAEEVSRNGRNPNLKRLAVSLIETRKKDLAYLMSIRDAGTGSDEDPPVR